MDQRKLSGRNFWKIVINILSQVSDGITIEVLESKIKQDITLALESIPESKGSANKKIVLWWNEICKETVRNRRKAFKLFKIIIFNI